MKRGAASRGSDQEAPPTDERIAYALRQVESGAVSLTSRARLPRKREKNRFFFLRVPTGARALSEYDAPAGGYPPGSAVNADARSLRTQLCLKPHPPHCLMYCCVVGLCTT